ncbi:hypothetical protein [Vibrio breoganii]|uniref:hypothetical protein n=1 Tax=Vibrio breoganii TaxID=553239 RepID=UPI000C81ECED|nr:hypothetical protein [Vibrio breoganii]PMG01795.1 hypothetical protein BCV00_17965 [Vibrio breoganii]PMG97737.1 hypothetical protein BCU79_18870 [Vibrio breoganii]
MCKQSGFSRYQKRVIKFLTDYLGANIPFTYERTQTNHMKVLIDGVPKPLFTGSTPSDKKTFNNFIAEVKREVKAIDSADEPEVSSTQVSKTIIVHKESNDRLIQSSVKALRGRIDSLKTREEEQVLETRALECVDTLRSDTVKHALSLAMQARKQGAYLKPKDIKVLEDKIRNHLDFMMPTMACYGELLNSKTKYSVAKTTALVAVNDEVITEEAESTPLEQLKPLDAVPMVKPSEIKQADLPANDLLKMNSTERVNLLRKLSKSEALTLIEDIKQAIALNREQDIQSVVSLILEKDLPIEAIISRIDAA